jgi:hypothetical protein
MRVSTAGVIGRLLRIATGVAATLVRPRLRFVDRGSFLGNVSGIVDLAQPSGTGVRESAALECCEFVVGDDAFIEQRLGARDLVDTGGT